LAALNVRADLINADQTNAYRLITGHTEGLPGIVAERYGPVIILQVHEGPAPYPPKDLRQIAEWYANRFDARAVYLKHFDQDRSHRVVTESDPLLNPTPFVGSPVEPEIPVQENGLTYLISPFAGYSVGLFLDQRDNRQKIRTLAAGKRVLNTFAYTCAFSVIAAAGNAREIVSVDISPKYLDWGKRNFQANHFDPNAAEFYVADTLDFLKKTTKRNRRYDLIIIDPPTFARKRKSRKVFNLRQDLPALIRSAANVLDPDGVMLLSTNLRTATTPWLEKQIAAVGRPFKRLHAPSLPSDFASDQDHAKSLLVQFG
jgi:23S rRNA (cytosine1962-C5)-methyltransferase